MALSKEKAEGPQAENWLQNCRKEIYKDDYFYRFGEIKCVFPEFFGKCWTEDIQNFEVKKDDIFVCTFPKCGTTWTQEMVWLIKNDLDFETATTNYLTDRFPFFEFSALFAGSVDMNIPNTVKLIQEMPSPRFIKSHLPLSIFSQLQKAKPKIIYVARNPKETLISYYHHTVLLDGYKGTLNEFVESFITNNTLYAPYWGHIKEFWEIRDQENILFLTFEELKKDLRSVILKIAKFLDKKIESEEDMAKLLDHLSFEKIKDNKFVNMDQFESESEKFFGPRKTNFMRKGKIDSWKEELSPEMVDKMDKWIEENKIDGIWDFI